MAVSINDEIAYRGCNPNPEIIIPSKEIIEMSLYIKSLNLESHTLKRERLRKTLKESQEFLNGLYDLHYVPFEIEKKNMFFKFSFSGDINPFTIPIKREKGQDDFYGCLREIISLGNEIKISYKHIELSSNITKISGLSYTHEITHTQLNHMRGLIREYFNSEVLSIFNELLHAYHTKDSESLLREHDSRRLNELAYAIDELAKYHNSKDEDIINVLLEGSCYCESTFKAYNLFFKYYFGSNSTRKYIIQSIQRVFDGEITLEEILEQLGISLESSQDIKTLRKYLTR